MVNKLLSSFYKLFFLILVFSRFANADTLYLPISCASNSDVDLKPIFIGGEIAKFIGKRLISRQKNKIAADNFQSKDGKKKSALLARKMRILEKKIASLQSVVDEQRDCISDLKKKSQIASSSANKAVLEDYYKEEDDDIENDNSEIIALEESEEENRFNASKDSAVDNYSNPSEALLDESFNKQILANKMYKEAFNLMKGGRVSDSRELFLQFTNRFVESDLLADAEYWIADSFYKEQDYKNAAEHFLHAYKLSNQEDKSSYSLFKLSLCLSNLDNLKGSCSILSKILLDSAINAPEEVKKIARAEYNKIMCDHFLNDDKG